MEHHEQVKQVTYRRPATIVSIRPAGALVAGAAVLPDERDWRQTNHLRPVNVRGLASGLAAAASHETHLLARGQSGTTLGDLSDVQF